MADNIDGIIERIKKAVRLANKTTEAGERETAMRLAKNLAEKNGIAFAEIAVDEESVCKAQRAQTGRPPTWWWTVASVRCCGRISAWCA